MFRRFSNRTREGADFLLCAQLSSIEDNFKGFIDDIGVFSCDVFSLTWSNPVGKSDSMKRFNSQGLLSVELRLMFVRHIHFTLVGVFLFFNSTESLAVVGGGRRGGGSTQS